LSFYFAVAQIQGAYHRGVLAVSDEFLQKWAGEMSERAGWLGVLLAAAKQHELSAAQLSEELRSVVRYMLTKKHTVQGHDSREWRPQNANSGRSHPRE
jgi:hypothetical protein